MIPTEDDEQCTVCDYLDARQIPYYSIPNEGKRTPAQAMRHKKLGLKSGVPDICLPIMRYPYGGLYIEMKRRKGGVVTEKQDYWIELLRHNGYWVEVCLGADHAIRVVKEYLAVKQELR